MYAPAPDLHMYFYKESKDFRSCRIEMYDV